MHSESSEKSILILIFGLYLASEPTFYRFEKTAKICFIFWKKVKIRQIWESKNCIKISPICTTAKITPGHKIGLYYDSFLCPPAYVPLWKFLFALIHALKAAAYHIVFILKFTIESWVAPIFLMLFFFAMTRRHSLFGLSLPLYNNMAAIYMELSNGLCPKCLQSFFSVALEKEENAYKLVERFNAFSRKINSVWINLLAENKS